MQKLERTQTNALKHLELATSILRSKNFIEIPTVTANETPENIKQKATELAQQIYLKTPEAFTAELERALFKISIRREPIPA